MSTDLKVSGGWIIDYVYSLSVSGLLSCVVPTHLSNLSSFTSVLLKRRGS